MESASCTEIFILAPFLTRQSTNRPRHLLSFSPIAMACGPVVALFEESGFLLCVPLRAQ